MRKNYLQPGLLFCWRRSLWQIKRQQFQRHCRLKNRIPLKYPVCSLRIYQCLRTLVARLSVVEEKIMKEIRSESSEKGCGRGWKVKTSLTLEIIFKLPATQSTKRSMESSSTQSRTSELLRKELRSLRTLIRVRRQPVSTKVD